MKNTYLKRWVFFYALKAQILRYVCKKLKNGLALVFIHFFMKISLFVLKRLKDKRKITLFLIL